MLFICRRRRANRLWWLAQSPVPSLPSLSFQVPEVISGIRQVSKSALKEDAKLKQEADEAFYNSQKFEVLYCGKVEVRAHVANVGVLSFNRATEWVPLHVKQLQVTVGHKKATSTLIDDCVDKFRQHEVERKRLRLLNGQRGSTDSAPVEFFLDAEVDPLSSVLNETSEDTGVPGVEDVTRVGGKCL